MTTSTQNDNLRVARASVKLSGLPGGHPNWGLEAAEQSPPRLRPGAAVTFAVATVVALLCLIEILIS